MTSARTVPYPALAESCIPARGLARDLGLVLGASVVVALSAQPGFMLPLSPVPITGLTFGILLVGAALGSRLGMLAVAAWVLEGAAGLPVFSGATGGLLKIWGPTGGYILAAPLAAGAIGWLVEHRGLDRSFRGTLVAMAAGNAVLYAVGLAWLSIWLAGVSRWTGGASVLTQGMLLFLPGDALKALAAAALLPSAWRLLRPGSR